MEERSRAAGRERDAENGRLFGCADQEVGAVRAAEDTTREALDAAWVGRSVFARLVVGQVDNDTHRAGGQDTFEVVRLQ